jgi:AcrR family transcriptional regulator
MAQRGRPRADEQPHRRDAVLDAALAELGQSGYEAATMLAVARRAGASKETLYRWFGDKKGLFAAVIERNAGRTNRAVVGALAVDGDHVEVLTEVARGLVDLLLSEPALALNRAAITSPELARTLLAHGRHTTGPIVERFLARLAAEGVLIIDDPADAFQLFYGLVIQDLQIRALLGEAPLPPARRARHARRAVERFLALTTSGH